MLTCKEITELATEYSEGALDAPRARSFEQHLSLCDGCRAWARQLEAVRGAVHGLEAPEPSAAHTAAILGRFDDWQAARASARAAPTAAAKGPRLDRLAPLVLAAAAAGLAVLARRPSHEPGDWAIALGLAASSAGVAALVRRLTIRSGAAVASAALVAALLRGGEGPLAVPRGLECLLVEAGMAGGAAFFAWRLLRRGPDVAFTSAGVWAVAGALAGDAALQVSCVQHDSLPHLLVFHLGGLLVTVAASWLLTGRRLLAS